MHPPQGEGETCAMSIDETASKGSDECPNDSADAGNRGNLRARPTKIGTQRHNKHGEHSNGRGAIGEIHA